MPAFKTADVVTFGSRHYMLLERTFAAGPHPMWLAVEPFNPDAEPRLLCESDIRLIHDEAQPPAPVECPASPR